MSTIVDHRKGGVQKPAARYRQMNAQKDSFDRIDIKLGKGGFGNVVDERDTEVVFTVDGMRLTETLLTEYEGKDGVHLVFEPLDYDKWCPTEEKFRKLFERLNKSADQHTAIYDFFGSDIKTKIRNKGKVTDFESVKFMGTNKPVTCPEDVDRVYGRYNECTIKFSIGVKPDPERSASWCSLHELQVKKKRTQSVPKKRAASQELIDDLVDPNEFVNDFTE